MTPAARLLRVDLTSATCHWENLPATLLAAWPGGRGLGVRLLRDYAQLPVDDPRLPLLVCPGPLCGSGAPAATRFSVISRSPLTMTVADASDGGPLALGLSALGCAALLVSGRSPRPVVLHLDGDGARLVPAGDLAGCGAVTTTRRLARPGYGVLAIGPAGENGVPLANLHAGDGNGFGRGGLGAVMGGKGLKAIVAGPDGALPASAEPARFAAAREDILRLFRASPVLCGELGFGVFGTPALVDLVNRRQLLPTANWRASSCAAATAFSGPALARACAPQAFGCHDCPIRCKQRNAEGLALPGYEALAQWGALCGVHALPDLLAINTLCNELGVDPVSTAATFATWGACRGRAPETAEICALLPELAHNRGHGALLAQGARAVALAHGRPEAAATVKGLELPPVDPRGAGGVALGYAVSTNGGALEHANPIASELLRKPVPVERLTLTGKARLVRLAEDSLAAADSLGVCRHALYAAGLEEYAALLSAHRGQPWDAAALQELGARVVLSERRYNQENGFTAADDTLPERFFGSAGENFAGPPTLPLDRAAFNAELQRYYRIRGLGSDGAVADGWLEAQP